MRSSSSAGTRARMPRRLLRRVAVLVQVVVDGALPRVCGAPHLVRERLDRQGLPGLREPLGPADRGFHVRQRALEPAERRREEADALVEIDDVALEASGRAEVDDLDRHRPVDPVEPADPLLHRGGVARQVEEDEAAAELEVAALAARFRRDQDRRSVRPPELGDLDVSALGRELLVEDRDALAGRGLQPLLQGRQRRALVDEDERLGRAERAPDLVLPRDPRDARIRGVLLLVAGQARGGRRRSSRSTGAGTRGWSPPMSTRRVALVHGGSGSPRSSASRNASSDV